MKRTFIFIVVCSIILSCSGCVKDDKNNPRNSSMTKWIASNMTMYIVDADNGFVLFNQNDDNIVLYIKFARDNNIVAFEQNSYLTKNYDYGDYLEKWKLNKMKKSSFVALVKDTTYFEEGQEIKFELVEENIDESEIPYPPLPEASTDDGSNESNSDSLLSSNILSN